MWTMSQIALIDCIAGGDSTLIVDLVSQSFHVQVCMLFQRTLNVEKRAVYKVLPILAIASKTIGMIGVSGGGSEFGIAADY
jgi:hypothetical protein